ncbi:carbon-phosphorus lyase complex subunit PhnI [Hypericibacter sp.]|uniref:carbon-phosphorus lyase complex subunit PhnI n=1 Tax=Hypericibacter sp. TaxID=2705401 RepID=UPI003D6D7DE4
MYVAVKGGEAAIEAAHRLLEQDRRGDPAIPVLTVDQIEGQLRLAVDRVMAEGALYDRRLAALAIKQAAGDMVEAIFLLRAYRTTLPRFAVSEPIETASMAADRRISAIFKDVPGGQFLGPTFDYTHRLLDFELAGNAASEPEPALSAPIALAAVPPVMSWLEQEGLLEPERPKPDLPIGDITRDPPQYPATRDVRLQALARGDEGFLLSLAYSTQRGYGRNHPFAGEIRSGRVTVEIVPEELGFAVAIGEIEVTECQLVNQFKGSATQPPQFTRGYGLVFGRCERKAMAMALVDRSLRAAEFEETVTAPAQDEEFVLSHADNVEASGFVQHLKLPHYVDFQAELDIVRRMRAEEARQEAAE